MLKINHADGKTPSAKAIEKNAPLTGPKQVKENTFPIVAIGASSGGLEAVTELLKYLPPDTGMAYIFIQHLSPDHKSILVSLLAKSTEMIVQEIEDMDKMKPDNIYVIPYNKGIEVTDGHIQLIPRVKKGAAMSIDILFNSLAETHKEGAIGIVLSGNASDGTIGLKAIKEQGGITFAQDNSAKHPSMPQSAINEGVADFILAPKEIALELSRISKHVLKKKKILEAGDQKIIDENDLDLKIIIKLLYDRIGVDFSHYKMNTIKRRILRRMFFHKLDTFNKYTKLLKINTNEINALYDDLLINFTDFFRDTEAFLYFKTTLFPKLLKNKASNETLRIWIVACSTGQEAYSVAMLLIETLDHKFTGKQVQIFATDLSEHAIKKARIGEYSQEEVKTISPKRLERFFTKVGDKYRIAKVVRDMCSFAPHNVLSHPPFSRMDFISCCNLLIYLDVEMHKKVLKIFHYALNDDGYLMLGKAETVSSSQLFSNINTKLKLYARKDGVRSLSDPGLHASRPKAKPPQKIIDADAINIDTSINSILFSRYIPTYIVVNHDLDIVEFKGTTSKYLEHSTGKATLNVLNMARPEIAFELLDAIRKAIETEQEIHKTDIKMKIDAVLHTVAMDIIPLKKVENEPLLLVVFTEKEHAEWQGYDLKAKKNSLTEKNNTIKLNEALAIVRNELISVSKEKEKAIKILQTAQEEVLSSNEEFQCMNEELETSKEEIESANEELTITNQELQTRNEQLGEAYDFSEAIVTTLHEPMLILDKNLRVKSANKAFYTRFKANQADTENTLIFELGNKQWDIPKLRELLENILPRNTYFDNFEITHTFPQIGEKIMTLNARRIVQKVKHDELIILFIKDITEVRKVALELAEQRIEAEKRISDGFKASEKRYNNMLMQSSFAFGVLKGKEMVITLANDSIKEIWGKGKDVENKKLIEVLPEIKDQSFPALLEKVYTTGVPFYGYEILAKLVRNGKLEDVYFNFAYQPYLEADETISGVTIIAYEVTSDVIAKKRVEESEAQYRQLVQGLPVALYTCDADGYILLYNKAAVELWGREPEVGKEKWCGSFRIYKTDGVLLPLDECPMAIVLKEDRIEQFEVILERPDGTLRNIMPHPQPVYNSNGKIVGAINMLLDITEAKKAKEQERIALERFHFIADAMPQKVWAADADGNVNYLNKLWFDYTGLSFEELKDWGWEKNIHGDDWDENKKRWQQSIDTGNNFELEHRILDKDSIYRWHLSRGIAYKDGNGNIEMWVGTNTEIEKQKMKTLELEDAVRQRTTELEQSYIALKGKNVTLEKANKELETFTFISSHDLQEPLRKIKNFAAGLLQEDQTQLSDTSKDYLKRMQETVKRMQKLLEDLLTYSRVKDIVHNFEKTDLNIIAEEVIADFKETLNEKNAIIKTSGLCEVSIIRFQFRQLLTNLIRNSLKFSDRERPLLIIIQSNIALGKELDNNDLLAETTYCHMTFTDNGIGFDPLYKDIIFEVFQRLHEYEEYKGTGIGLAICKRIVENHNGIITATGILTKGVTFNIYLPVTL